MEYLAILGRQADISLAELGALFSNVKKISPSLATFTAPEYTDFSRLGGTIKVGVKLDTPVIDFLQALPDGKITLGISDYSRNAKSTMKDALKFKNILTRHGRSVRVVSSSTPALSTATSLHNGLSGKNERKVELIKNGDTWYRVVFVSDIDAYTRRDQARPARDAKVGMLPPKLAQILINLCGPLPEGSRILDPFCGTGVILQEALLMGYRAYGTDLSDRMVDYSKKNLEWLSEKYCSTGRFGAYERDSEGRDTRDGGMARPRPRETCIFSLSQGDATSFHWTQPIDAVACEGYLGRPMSQIPVEIKLKTEKQECRSIILSFLKNLSTQIKPGTPVVIATPAWLRNDGTYSRLEILDEVSDMGYNVKDISREGLLYHRDDQIVARDIIILRKN